MRQNGFPMQSSLPPHVAQALSRVRVSHPVATVFCTSHPQEDTEWLCCSLRLSIPLDHPTRSLPWQVPNPLLEPERDPKHKPSDRIHRAANWQSPCYSAKCTPAALRLAAGERSFSKSILCRGRRWHRSTRTWFRSISPTSSVSPPFLPPSPPQRYGQLPPPHGWLVQTGTIGSGHSPWLHAESQCGLVQSLVTRLHSPLHIA